MAWAFEWSEEQKGRLLSLYNRGWSFTEIAAELGCTRNAAIGKAHRLKFPMRVIAKPTEVIEEKPEPVIVKEGKPVIVVRKDDEVKQDSGAGIGIGISIDDLNNATCRFPMWPHVPSYTIERRYCGELGADLATGHPYCRKHARICGTDR